jgi:hypothetical protein
MKRFAAITLAACCAAPAFAQSNVGVSIGINQPGVYGRIDIGNYPQPALVYAQPIMIAPHPANVYVQPAYLYVPPEHQKNWSRHCGSYNACGQPVYFVQERWVRDRYNEQERHARNDHQGNKDNGHKGGKGGKGGD